MKNKHSIEQRQLAFVTDQRKAAEALVGTIDKSGLETVLLSGSVARGDFFPGRYGGMIDLIVMRKSGSGCSAESIFGADEEPGIPYHCVTKENHAYQILFTDFIDRAAFIEKEEPRKYSILESCILWDDHQRFAKSLAEISDYARSDIAERWERCLGYIHYLLSDYKKDRWQRRDAFCQLHDNLNTAIRLSVQCLFYLNGQYAPAEDRRLYYSYTLAHLPEAYAATIEELYCQTLSSEASYRKREARFRETLLDFISRSRQA